MGGWVGTWIDGEKRHGSFLCVDAVRIEEGSPARAVLHIGTGAWVGGWVGGLGQEKEG